MTWRGAGRSKFGNVPLRCAEGVMHQSKLESKRCNELHVMQRAGMISSLEAHPQKRFRLEVNGVHVCDYLSDFVYLDSSGAQVIEDVKGRATEVYKLKARLMRALGWPIEEVRR